MSDGLRPIGGGFAAIAERAPKIRDGIEAAIRYEIMAVKREAMLNLSGHALQVRSGRLRGSVDVQVRRSTRDRTTAVIAAGGSGVKYARIWEERRLTTIRPKRGKYLTIPLDAAKTAAGVTRGNARSFPNTFFLFRKGRTPLIMQRKGKKVVPLFALAKQVRIGNRPYLRPAIEKRRPHLEKRIRQEIGRRLARSA